MKVAGFVRGSSVNFVLFYNSACQVEAGDFSADFFFDGVPGSVKVQLERVLFEDLSVGDYVNNANYGYKEFSCFSCVIPDCASYLSGEKIVSSILFELNGSHVEYVSPELSLKVTFFDSFNVFHKSFSFAKGRHTDPETVMFIAHNNLSSDVCRSPTVWVTSFTIYCYKYLQIFSVESKDISQFFRKAESVCSILSDEEKKLRTVRVDPQSRMISIYTSYLHYLISFSDFDFANELLDKLFQSVDLNDVWKYDYNFSRVIMFKMALSRKVEGDGFYVNLIRRVILKNRAEELGEMSYVHIKEFSTTLDLISCILRFSEEENLSVWQRAYLVKNASRVSADVFMDRLGKAFKRF